MEKMQFLVEAYIGIGFKRYCLQRNETWKEITSPLSKNSPQFNPDDSYDEQDKLWECLDETQRYVEQKGMIVLSDNKYEINERGCSLADMVMVNRVFMHAKVKRMMRPRQFSVRNYEE